MIFFILSLLFWLSAWSVNIWIARKDSKKVMEGAPTSIIWTKYSSYLGSNDNMF